MNDEGILKSTVTRLSAEIELLENQRDEIMNRLSDLVRKRDILLRAEEVLNETHWGPPGQTDRHKVNQRPEATEQFGSDSKEYKDKVTAGENTRDNRGMTAAALKLFSSGDVQLTAREVLHGLEHEGYKAKRLNIYVMLKRLVEAGRLSLNEKDGENRYFLPAAGKTGPAQQGS